MIDFALEPVRRIFADSLAVINETSALDYVIEDMGILIAQSVVNGGKLMVCGNGGSQADADHLVAEFLVRLNPDTDRPPIPALNLSMDMATMTACSNDYGYNSVPARMVNAMGQLEDALLVISTSGNSPNVIYALEAAREKGIAALGLLGAGGGSAFDLCDIALVVPSADTGRIQEAHAVCIHALAQVVETVWLKR